MTWRRIHLAGLLAIVAAFMLAGSTLAHPATAAVDPDPRVDPPVVVSIPGSTAPLCLGHRVTLNVPPGGLDYYPPPGPEVIRGTSGYDQIHAGDDDDVICGEGGADTIWGNGGVDIIDGGTEGDSLYGGHDNDTLTGGEGDDTLAGDEEDDTLWGQGGGDTLHCGTGYDTADGGIGAPRDYWAPFHSCENRSNVP
jgi:hypothetical protein